MPPRLSADESAVAVVGATRGGATGGVWAAGGAAMGSVVSSVGAATGRRGEEREMTYEQAG